MEDTEQQDEVMQEAAADAPRRDPAAAPKEKGWAGKKIAAVSGWANKKFNNGIKSLIRYGFKTIFSSRINGLEHFKDIQGDRTLIVANHISFLDGVLLASTLPVEPVFAIDTAAYKKGQQNLFYRFLMSRMDMCPIDETKAIHLRGLVDKIKSGKPVMIFPEGRLTTTGTLMQIFEGTTFVADEAKATIVPVHLGGMEFLSFGTTYLRQFPKKWFPKISVTVTKPQKFDMDDSLKGKKRRAERLSQLETIMKELPVAALNTEKTMMSELRYAASHFGMKYQIMDDRDTAEARMPLTYGSMMTRICALGDKFSGMTKQSESVGLLLPNSGGFTAAFWGLQDAGCVAAPLNAAADVPTLLSCAETAALKTIVTSRRFIKESAEKDPKIKIEEKIAELSKTCKIVYLEDMKNDMSRLDMLRAKIRAKTLSPGRGKNRTGSDPAVVIFTSGSEAAPKGVVLSSSNILSNITQMSTITEFSPKDKLFNAMPVFHSFGLCGGMIMPMLKGIRSNQFPTPLAAKSIPGSIYFYDATIMFGTNTFLKLYARNATDRDLLSLRKGVVFAGAEALEQSTYDTYIDRFGVRIMEGYGMTEASPVVTANVPEAFQKGTLGKFLPGIEPRLEAMAGMEEGCYHLFVKGPNTMLGYMKNDQPGVIQPPQDGEHDAGDAVKLLDKNGRTVILPVRQDGEAEADYNAKVSRIAKNSFVKYVCRIKRIAKIAGEMVALDNIEAVARAASPQPEKAHAIISYKAPEEGDRIVLFTTDPGLKRDDLTKAAQSMNRGILGLPKKQDVHFIAEMPRLGTGKTDYVKLQKMYAEMQSAKMTTLTEGTAAGFNKASAAPEVVVMNDNKADSQPVKQQVKTPGLN